jgi:hypothetical protein
MNQVSNLWMFYVRSMVGNMKIDANEQMFYFYVNVKKYATLSILDCAVY